MIQTQRDVVIKLLYLNLHNKNILEVLNGVHAEIREQKHDLQNVGFSFND
jgi:hypothetical protein